MTSSTWVVSATCKLLWLRNLLKEFGFARDAPMALYFDNISTLFSVLNLRCTKNIQSPLKLTVTLFVKSGKKEIQLEYACMEDQVADFFFSEKAMLKGNFICVS